MNRKTGTTCLTAVLCLIAATRDFAQEVADPSSVDRNALNFSTSILLHRGVGSSLSSPSYIWTMGMGFGIASRLDLGIRILYGNMSIPPGENRPEQGVDNLAGGGIEARFLLLRGSVWAPFIGMGYDLVTILHEEIAHSKGYSGHGIRGTVGCEYALSRIFGATAEASYWHGRFDKLYTQQATNIAFEPFENDVVTFAVSIRFYFSSSGPSTKVGPKE